jgi:hypothetical protein
MEATMRYFFHIRSNDGDEPDDEGLEFESLDIAVNEAEKTAREMVAERVMHDERIDGTRFEISDEQGNVLATLPFKEVLRLD